MSDLSLLGNADRQTFVGAGRPQGSQSRALHKLGVGGGYEIPNIPENKTRCGFVLEGIKIYENTLVAFLA